MTTTQLHLRPAALVSWPGICRHRNGIAGQTAAEELRKADADASIVMIAASGILLQPGRAARYLRARSAARKS